MKANLEELGEMLTELFKQQCDLDIQKAMVKHFIKEKQAEQLNLTDVSESCKINGKGLCGYSNKLGLCPRCDTDAYSR